MDGPIPGPGGSGAVDADRAGVGPAREAAAVLDQKARRAGELVGLLGHDRHGQVLAGQIGTGQLHTFPGVGLVEIHDRGLLVGPGRGQGVQ